MDDLLKEMQTSVPWLAPVLGTIVLLLTLPLVERQSRATLAFVFTIVAVAVGLTTLSAEGSRVLEIVNPFPPTEAPGEGVPMLESRIIERQEAPAWAWPALVAGLYLALAAGAWLTRKRDGSKGLWLHATLVGLFVVGARLCMEKVAAPSGLVWATGASFAMVILGVYFGLYSRRRGNGLWAMVGGALLSGLVIRAGICAVSYVATTQQLGSHLDVHSIGEWNSAFAGPQSFETDMDKWVGNIVIPQMTMWAPMHALCALVFGGLVRFLTREKSPKTGSKKLSKKDDAFEAAMPPVS